MSQEFYARIMPEVSASARGRLPTHEAFLRDTSSSAEEMGQTIGFMLQELGPLSHSFTVLAVHSGNGAEALRLAIDVDVLASETDPSLAQGSDILAAAFAKFGLIKAGTWYCENLTPDSLLAHSKRAIVYASLNTLESAVAFLQEELKDIVAGYPEVQRDAGQGSVEYLVAKLPIDIDLATEIRERGLECESATRLELDGGELAVTIVALYTPCCPAETARLYERTIEAAAGGGFVAREHMRGFSVGQPLDSLGKKETVESDAFLLKAVRALSGNVSRKTVLVIGNDTERVADRLEARKTLFLGSKVTPKISSLDGESVDLVLFAGAFHERPFAGMQALVEQDLPRVLSKEATVLVYDYDPLLCGDYIEPRYGEFIELYESAVRAARGDAPLVGFDYTTEEEVTETMARIGLVGTKSVSDKSPLRRYVASYGRT